MVSVFPVDLEYLQFADLRDPEQQRLVDATIDAQLEPLKEQNLTDRKNTLVTGTILWEINKSTDSLIKQNFQYFENKCNGLDLRAHLITGIEMQDLVVDVENSTCVDFTLLRSRHYANLPGQSLNNKWHPENKKFLFLMGKSLKPHRIGLLYRFYKQGLLDDTQCIWSFYDQISVKDCNGLVPDTATTSDLETLINNYRRSPDQASPTNSHYRGFPFDPQLYKNTNLSIVSETSHNGSPWNSEKIYRPILNYHPFIIAGPAEHSQYMQDMGFETFDQYFAVPEYDSIADLNLRLDAIVENVKNFNPSIEQIQQIHTATHKNVVRLHELAEYHIGTINQMLAGYGASKHWTEILPLQDSEFLTWQYYYQTIKGTNWPPCATVADCVNLPAEIQQELRTKFNLNF
jgi:hypothetical protein